MDLWVDVICICIFKIKDCSLASDVNCSKLHVVMEAVQAFLIVAKLTESGPRNVQCRFAKVCIHS